MFEITVSKWFLREPLKNSTSRIFCLPYSGCGASMYRSWPRLIDGIEICPIQIPGRENRFRERNFDTYEELVNNMINDISPFLDKDFAFFGHCGSALIAYEATLNLVKNGSHIPKCLFISSQVAPQDGPYGRFLELTDDYLRKELELLINRMGGVLIPDLIELSLSVLRKDIEMNKLYHPINNKVILPCKIEAIGWENDDEVPINLMCGWGEHGNVKYRVLSGDHHEFLKLPQQLVDVFKEGLL